MSKPGYDPKTTTDFRTLFKAWQADCEAGLAPFDEHAYRAALYLLITRGHACPDPRPDLEAPIPDYVEPGFFAREYLWGPEFGFFPWLGNPKNYAVKDYKGNIQPALIVVDESHADLADFSGKYAVCLPVTEDDFGGSLSGFFDFLIRNFTSWAGYSTKENKALVDLFEVLPYRGGVPHLSAHIDGDTSLRKLVAELLTYGLVVHALKSEDDNGDFSPEVLAELGVTDSLIRKTEIREAGKLLDLDPWQWEVILDGKDPHHLNLSFGLHRAVKQGIISMEKVNNPTEHDPINGILAKLLKANTDKDGKPILIIKRSFTIMENEDTLPQESA